VQGLEADSAQQWPTDAGGKMFSKWTPRENDEELTTDDTITIKGYSRQAISVRIADCGWRFICTA
jgi:hypothetical protein